MQTEQYHVPSISCQHCVRAVTTEVNKLVGVSEINVDLTTKIVTVAHNEFVSPGAIVAAIKEAGYEDVAPIQA